MVGVCSAVQEAVGQSVTGRTWSSGSDPFVWDRFVRLSWKVSLFIQMCSTHSENLCRTLKYDIDGSSSLVRAQKSVNTVYKVTEEWNNPLLLLSYYLVYENSLEYKRPEQDGILKVTRASGKHREKKLSFLENERRLIDETIEELTKSCVNQKTVVRNRKRT